MSQTGMDTLIGQYDFLKATEDDENEFVDKLNDLNIDPEGLTQKELLTILHAYKTKVCVEGFPKRMSPGYWMAFRGLETLLSAISTETPNISDEEKNRSLFDLYLTLIRSGPGTTHCELMENISGEIKEFLQNLRGEDLKSWASAVKELMYVPEADSDIDEQTKYYESSIPDQLAIVVGKDESRYKDITIWEIFMDLHMFCLTSFLRLPEQFSRTLDSCMDELARPFGEKFYSEYPKADKIRENIKSYTKVISHKELHLKEGILRPARNMERMIVKIIKTSHVTEVWEELLLMVKTLCCHDNVSQLEDLIRNLDDIVYDVDNNVLQANPKMFETWAPIAAEILNKAENNVKVFTVMARQCDKMESTAPPPKPGYDTLWIAILKGLVRMPVHKSLRVAKSLISNSASKNLKKTWKWKEHVEDAKEIIQQIGAMPFPISTDSDSNDGHDYSDAVDECEEILEKLVKNLENAKRSDEVMPYLAEVCLSKLEERNSITAEIADKSADLLDLKAHRDKVEGYLTRYLPLYLDEDYPWDNHDLKCAGQSFLMNVIESFDTSKEMSEGIHKMLIEILMYTMDEKHEVTSLSSGDFSIFTFVLFSCVPVYMTKHRGQDTVAMIEPMLGPMFKVLINNMEEEDLHNILLSITYSIAISEPQILTPYSQEIMDLYLENRQSQVLVLMHTSYKHTRDATVLEEHFTQLMEVFMEDQDTYNVQIMFLTDIAKSHPQLFDAGTIDGIMTHHFKNGQSSIPTVLFLEALAVKRQELIKPYFPGKILNNPAIPVMMAKSIAKIAVSMTEKYNEYKDTVLKYLIETFKKSAEATQVTAMVTGLREMCALFGLDTVKPYRDVVEKKKEESTDMVIQDAASTLLDVIDGRSLAKVAQDLDEKQEDIDKLNVAVAGTKVVVKKVQRTVNEHDKEIKETKAGLIDVNQRVDVVEEDLEETKGKVEEIDMKTMTNAPKWSRDVTKLMNTESDHDWRLLSSRLGYSADDIRGWATQSDPCMAMLSEWYATHKTVEATHGVLVALQEMNREDAAVIVENAMKAVEGIVADEPVDYPEPPEIFLSYQWGHQNEVKLIQRHLERAGYKCWMDIGQMGGGDKLFEKIDTGIRAAKIIICCVTEKYAKSPNCNREVNLSVNLGKPIIPLLVEKMSWPPKGSMGPIFSEYLFIRFFQRPGEETKDDRIWPVAKFQELLMQLNCFKVMPDETAVTDEYKNWWIPVLEEIIIEKKNTKTVGENKVTTTHTENDSGSPDVFISYQWGKQKEISVLYQRLTGLGYTCWMDIHQMGGGDSLYDKIDRGIRGCKVVLTSITQKYSLSANCRREVSLADALKKPIIPLLMEKSDWPPSGPMSMVFTQLLFINFCKDESVQLRWDGPKFEELQQKLHQHVPLDNDEGLKQEEPPVTMETVANGSSDKKEMKKDEKSQDNARIHNQQSSKETKDVPLSSQGNDSASGKPVINNIPASSSNSTNTTAGNKVSSDTTTGPDQSKDTAKTNVKEQKSAKKSSTCSIL